MRFSFFHPRSRVGTRDVAYGYRRHAVEDLRRRDGQRAEPDFILNFGPGFLPPPQRSGRPSLSSSVTLISTPIPGPSFATGVLSTWTDSTSFDSPLASVA